MPLFQRSFVATLSLLLQARQLSTIANSFPLAGTPDLALETTVALRSSSFWELAHSEAFYRDTRLPSGNVRQRVVGLSNWISPPDVGNSNNKDVELASSSSSVAASANKGGRAARVANVLFTATLATAASTATKGEQSLQRKAHLAYDITSPFGTSEAKVVQHLELGVVQNGTIQYSEASCVSGFPMMSGDLNCKTTYAVTQSEADPDTSVVRVAVEVDDIKLPFGASFLKGRIKKIMRKDLTKQAKRYLDAMAKVEAEHEMRP